MIQACGPALFALEEHCRFAQDPAWLEECCPAAMKMAERILRMLEEQNEDDDKGFPLERIWAIHGLQSAASLTSAYGDASLADRFHQHAAGLESSLTAHVVDRVDHKKTPFLTEGSAISVNPAGLLDLAALIWPRTLLDPRSRVTRRILWKYWENAFQSSDSRFDNKSACLAQMCWAMILLYQPEQALECLETYLDLQAIPELLMMNGEDPGFRRCATFILAFRMMFLHETRDTVYLGPCLPMPWYDYQDAVGVKDAITPFGLISFVASHEDRAWSINLDTSASPAGGYVLRPAGVSAEPVIEVDGKTIRPRHDFARYGEIPLPPGFLHVKVR